MAYFPIITLAGSPGTDPVADGFFTVPGNQTAIFHGIVGSPAIPATEFIAFDDNAPSSLLYPFVYGGSPILLRFTVATAVFNGGDNVTEITPIETIQPIAGTYQQLVDSPYVIPFSDSNKTPINIPALESDSTLSITLPARGILDFGQIVDTNFLQLLENFAGPVAPGGTGSPFQKVPVDGQLWFDTSGSPPQNLIRVWDGTSWVGFEGTGTTDDVLDSNTAFSVNLVTDGITPINVMVRPRLPTQSFQQVFKNGVLQREDVLSFPANGNYYITAVGGDIVFAFDLDPADEVLVYAL